MWVVAPHFLSLFTVFISLLCDGQHFIVCGYGRLVDWLLTVDVVVVFHQVECGIPCKLAHAPHFSQLINVSKVPGLPYFVWLALHSWSITFEGITFCLQCLIETLEVGAANWMTNLPCPIFLHCAAPVLLDEMAIVREPLQGRYAMKMQR